MHITKEEFPSDDIVLFQNPEWSISFVNDYSRFLKKWYVTITMSYTLKDRGEQKAFLEMFKIYEVSGDPDEESKLDVKQELLEQTRATLLGIWAAISEKQPTQPLPPLIYAVKYAVHFMLVIADGWL